MMMGMATKSLDLQPGKGVEFYKFDQVRTYLELSVGEELNATSARATRRRDGRAVSSSLSCLPRGGV